MDLLDQSLTEIDTGFDAVKKRKYIPSALMGKIDMSESIEFDPKKHGFDKHPVKKTHRRVNRHNPKSHQVTVSHQIIAPSDTGSKTKLSREEEDIVSDILHSFGEIFDTQFKQNDIQPRNEGLEEIQSILDESDSTPEQQNNTESPAPQTQTEPDPPIRTSKPAQPKEDTSLVVTIQHLNEQINNLDSKIKTLTTERNRIDAKITDLKQQIKDIQDQLKKQKTVILDHTAKQYNMTAEEFLKLISNEN